MSETIQQKVTILEKRVGPNSKSPLFAQLASYYLLAGRAQDALRVCDEGIANFPFYTTGHLIKAKVLLTLNMSAEARRELEIVREYLPTNATINKFLTDIPVAPSELRAQKPAGARTAKPKTVEPPPESAPTVTPTVETPAMAEPPPVQEPSPLSAADMFGLTSAEPATPATPEPVAVPEPTGAFETAGQASTAEDPFGFGAAAPPAETPAVEPQSPVTETTSPFAGFESSPPAETSPVEQPFAGLPQPSEEESFDQYAARKRAEWPGQENTLSLDEYLGGGSSPFGPPPSEEPPPVSLPTIEQPNQIEELAQKLQGSKKITPVINLADKSPVTASESESPVSTGFVTPTLAEIYAKQGWYDDAIKAYRTLAVNKPAEREKFEKRIQELEEQKKQQSG